MSKLDQLVDEVAHEHAVRNASLLGRPPSRTSPDYIGARLNARQIIRRFVRKARKAGLLPALPRRGRTN